MHHFWFPTYVTLEKSKLKEKLSRKPISLLPSSTKEFTYYVMLNLTLLAAAYSKTATSARQKQKMFFSL